MTREQKICNNLGLVHSCARRFRDKGLEYDDLFQAGCIGLTKAVDGFEEERGLQFSTYAVPVILGEIRRLFREGGTVKMSRSLKELTLKVQKERAALCVQLGREPTVSELANRLEKEPEEVVEALQAGLPTLSLTSERPDEEGQTIDLPVPPPEDSITDRLALNQALSSLEKRDRALILLRYMGNKTQQATADRLGMTQVQVSRRERVILQELKRQLTG